MRVRSIWLVCLLLSFSLRAEELLPTVQRELRARKFYFGEIHGRSSDETVEAIKEFQRARGIDDSGNLDNETLRALGMPPAESVNREEIRRLEECCTRVLRYLQTWQSGDWEREATFFAASVDYYDDANVSREFIRDARVQENRRWPQRKSTLLNRIAASVPGSAEVQVTARVRWQVAGNSGPARVRTENIIFRLRKAGDGWQITAMKLLA